MNGKDIERLALLAHEAATEGSTWAELLRGLKDAFRADAALIDTPDDLQSDRSLLAVMGQSERTMPVVSPWADKDPWIERRLLLHRPMSAGVCQRGSDDLPDRELERTDYSTNRMSTHCADLKVRFAAPCMPAAP